MPPFAKQDVISTSYDVITSRCGPQTKHLWTYYLSSKSHCHSFYTCAPEDKEKPGLDRVRLLTLLVMVCCYDLFII